jgi:TRAP-type C4-dicarboxylate transport system permease small subunit
MKKLNVFLGNAEKAIACTFLLLTTSVAFFQVLNRHIFHLEIMGMGDLCIYAYMIALFFSFAYVAREDSQTAVEIVQNKLKERASPKWSQCYGVFLDAVSIGVVVIFLFPLYSAVGKAIRYPEWSVLIRWFNQSWLVQILFLTFCLCLFHMIAALWTKAAGVYATRQSGDRG